ncbi:Helix-turn-helix [Caloranaerobacter azorensis DSM 13643]|uniref:Helix-turn-helix n=1 Tax=Caloranaerobacter azorensis DSM 13643 TaxID=1121264 RepID=A0A1M5TTK9_9FIRM|nr:helix-turn-helix transcriptional regulator [Caloranaerobacter azorensis]SHH54064.1 Helix-turn-helix [Caloranaerobacter azorensis DSM 13643]
MLSRELKSLRIKNGFTQKALAREMGMSETSYSKRENGLIDFTVEEIRKLKSILKMTEDDIIRIFFSEEVA